MSVPRQELVAGVNARSMGLEAIGVGWLLTDSDLVLTDDGGATWDSILPPGIAASDVGAVDFVDRNTGWVAYSVGGADGTAAYVARTDDAGGTWTSTVVARADPEQSGVAWMDFASASQGWVLVADQSGSAYSIGTLHITTDGGSTWSAVDVPVAGPISIADAAHGVVADSRGASLPAWQTMDGGTSWERIALTPPPGFESADGFALPPTWTDAGSTMPVTYTREGKSAVEFLTGSEADDWTSAATVATGTEAGDVQPTAVLPSGIWLVLPASGQTRIEITNDGSHQSTVPTTGIPADATIVSLAFVDDSHGWALALNGSCAGFKTDCSTSSQIFSTDDGGVHWSSVGIPPPK